MSRVNLHAGLAEFATYTRFSVAIVAVSNAVKKLGPILVIVPIINLICGCFLSHNIKLLKMVNTQRKNAIYQWTDETTSGQR